MIKDFKFFNEDGTFFKNLLHLTMKEGLIHSVDYETFQNKLENLLKKHNLNYDLSLKTEYVKLLVDIKNKKQFNDELTSLLNNTGYFKSTIIDENEHIIKSLLSKGLTFIIFFNKRFDVPIDTPEYLFHATTKYYYQKIKKSGLSPKSQKMVSNDLDRIYLTNELSEALGFCTDKRFYIKNKYKNNDLFNMNIDEWVVLLIDIKSIPEIKLYKDTKMDNSYYTYNFIPSYAIKIKQEVNF